MSSDDTKLAAPTVVSIVGKSDSGKTTLIEKLIPALVGRGLRVGTIKHDVHGFEMDREGKDSYRHKHAGAAVTLISSPRQIGMVRDTQHDHTIDELLAPFLSDVDIVLTEGYKREAWPKVEVHRRVMKRPLLSDPSDGLIAVVTDEELAVDVPQFGLDAADAVAELLIRQFGLLSG